MLSCLPNLMSLSIFAVSIKKPHRNEADITIMIELANILPPLLKRLLFIIQFNQFSNHRRRKAIFSAF